MKAPSILIATARVRPGEEAAFLAWQIRHNLAVAKFPGLISSDMVPTGAIPGREWTIILNFQTEEYLATWQKSSERSELIAASVPFLEGGSLGEAMAVTGALPNTNVTEVILSMVTPGREDDYRAWSVRIQDAQSKYPGYRGMYLQPPTSKHGHWTTLVRYDSVPHLEAWLNAPERATLLEESKAFIEAEELSRLATSFPGWVPLDPVTGKGPPNWKTAFLVLAGLFPTVMVELRFLSPIFQGLSFNSSASTFIANALSVAFTTFVTMPLFVRGFEWWLFPKEDTAVTTGKGIAMLTLIFLLEVGLLWRFLPW